MKDIDYGREKARYERIMKFYRASSFETRCQQFVSAYIGFTQLILVSCASFDMKHFSLNFLSSRSLSIRPNYHNIALSSFMIAYGYDIDISVYTAFNIHCYQDFIDDSADICCRRKLSEYPRFIAMINTHVALLLTLERDR